MRRRNGFTLAETVVALALFSAAAVVFCQTALNARMAMQRPDGDDGQPSRTHRVYQEVLRITDRKAVEAGGEIVLATHVSKTELEADSGAKERVVAHWMATVSPSPLLDLQQITLSVTFLQEEGVAEAHEQIFHVYRTNWYEPGEREALLEAKQQEWDMQQERPL